MARTKNKKRQAPSLHSREAKRASSPSINLDKSLKSTNPPTESLDHRPSVLALHHGAGVTKKAKKGRAMSSKAKKRQERSLEKAELVLDRTEVKLAKSTGRAKTVKERGTAWEKLNEGLNAEIHEREEAETNEKLALAGKSLEKTVKLIAEEEGDAAPDQEEIL